MVDSVDSLGIPGLVRLCATCSSVNIATNDAASGNMADATAPAIAPKVRNVKTSRDDHLSRLIRW